MGEETSRAWCAKNQQRLMAAMDELWAAIENDLDREGMRKATEKVRLLGQMAATVRKIVTALPRERALRPAGATPMASAIAELEAERAPRAIDRLKGGARGRLWSNATVATPPCSSAA